MTTRGPVGLVHAIPADTPIFCKIRNFNRSLCKKYVFGKIKPVITVTVFAGYLSWNAREYSTHTFRIETTERVALYNYKTATWCFSHISEKNLYYPKNIAYTRLWEMFFRALGHPPTHLAKFTSIWAKIIRRKPPLKFACAWRVKFSWVQHRITPVTGFFGGQPGTQNDRQGLFYNLGKKYTLGFCLITALVDDLSRAQKTAIFTLHV